MDQLLIAHIYQELSDIYRYHRFGNNYGYFKKEIVLRHYETHYEELKEAVKTYASDGHCLLFEMPKTCPHHKRCHECETFSLELAFMQANHIQRK